MKLATLLILVAANQGYWFGGRASKIDLRVAARGGLPAADVIWDLGYDHLRLAGGSAPLDLNGTTILTMTPPSARARIELRFGYRLVARAGGAEIERGELPVHLFPDDMMSGTARQVSDKRLVVWDHPHGLPAMLRHAVVTFTRVDQADELQAMHPDVLLVGPGAIGESPFAQGPLLALAKSGTSVMIFRQTAPATLLGYPLATRDAPKALDWRADHPLLNGLEAKDLQSWLGGERSLSVVRLPADEPALEIGYFPREIAGDQPAPIDAVLVTRSVGLGRFVLCQLPLGDWSNDPRSQVLLRNAINYLLTPPQPTPRPSERPTARPVPPVAVPTIPVSSGDSP